MSNKLKIKVADITGLLLLIEYNGVLYATEDDFLRVHCNGTCTEKNACDELYNACKELAKKLTEETKLSILTCLLLSSIYNPGTPEKSNYYDGMLAFAADDLIKQTREEADND